MLEVFCAAEHTVEKRLKKSFFFKRRTNINFKNKAIEHTRIFALETIEVASEELHRRTWYFIHDEYDV
jgi:hypothetical protein